MTTKHSSSARPQHAAAPLPPPSEPQWLSLTELGRLHGISAVLCGRMLTAGGLRQADGSPTTQALHEGVAVLSHPRAHHRSALWQREACGRALQEQGVQPVMRHRMVQLWADLLEAVLHEPSVISHAAEDMAVEMPRELVGPVNHELEVRGSGFRVPTLRPRQPSRRASACWRARSSMSRS